VFGRALLAWFDRCRRDLPWRRTRDPYAILVSEVMLQQTQASRVAEYWQAFVTRFPTLRALASAGLDDVFAAWSGLGYYRRARALHDAARSVVASQGGSLPRTACGLRELPGVGAYTAAAVASIAFGEAVPVLDANAARVLSRVLAVRGGASTAAGRRRLLEEGARLIDRARPGDWNQAVMEIGATVCLPARPRCGECPVRAHCLGWRREGMGAYGPRARGTPPLAVVEAAAIVTRGARVLLVRGEHPRGWWRGLWALPRAHVPTAPSDPARLAPLLAREVRQSTGLSCRFDAAPAVARYSVTRHRVTMLVFRATEVSGQISAGAAASWFDAERLAGSGLPAPDGRVLGQPRGARSGPTPPRRRRR
jgi:A/G-specific adenine glycosylase